MTHELSVKDLRFAIEANWHIYDPFMKSMSSATLLLQIHTNLDYMGSGNICIVMMMGRRCFVKPRSRDI